MYWDNGFLLKFIFYWKVLKAEILSYTDISCTCVWRLSFDFMATNENIVPIAEIYYTIIQLDQQRIKQIHPTTFTVESSAKNLIEI